MRAPENEGGVFVKVDQVQATYHRIADELTSLRITMARVKLASYRQVGDDLRTLNEELSRFYVALDAARSKLGTQTGSRSTSGACKTMSR